MYFSSEEKFQIRKKRKLICFRFDLVVSVDYQVFYFGFCYCCFGCFLTFVIRFIVFDYCSVVCFVDYCYHVMAKESERVFFLVLLRKQFNLVIVPEPYQ